MMRVQRFAKQPLGW